MRSGVVAARRKCFRRYRLGLWLGAAASVLASTEPAPAQSASAGASGSQVAPHAVVIGDSIGVGIATAVGLPSHARTSFSLRRGNIVAAMAQVPPGSLAVLSAGLNDAGDPVAQLEPSLDKAIVAARKTGLRLVWLGPPCVFGKLAERAKELDRHLSRRLAGTGVEYVSLHDDWICQRENRTRDGIHFHHAGYVYLWDKVRREVPSVAAVTVARCEAAPRAKAAGRAAQASARTCTAEAR